MHFGLELRLDLLGMTMGQGMVPRGVGVNLGPIQADGAKAGQPVLTGYLQHLHKDRGELLAEAAAEVRQRVVVRVLVTGNEAERQRVIGRPLDLAAGVGAGGVAVDQQREQQGRMVGIAAATRIGPLQLR